MRSQLKLQDLLHKELFHDLKVEEGFRSKVYLDTTNNWTIGYGTNLSSRKLSNEEFKHLFKDVDLKHNNEHFIVKHWRTFDITQEQALYLLRIDIERCEKEAVEIYGNFYKQSFSNNVKLVVLDMLYNLGKSRYQLFMRHIRAMKELDFNKASLEIRNSRAYKQNTKRYEHFALVLDEEWRKRLNDLASQTTSETIKRK